MKQLVYNNYYNNNNDVVQGVVRVTSLSLHGAIFIIIPGHHPAVCISTPIHLCLHYHWHHHDLSMTKHASVHYLFAAVQNVRNNLSDTPMMFVMLDTTFKSMNVLQCARSIKLTY